MISRLAVRWAISSGRKSWGSSSFIIRKLRAIPYTISELIRLGTLDSKIAAYLWMLLETKGFVTVAGVTASGKTTLANSLATVLNPNWKILSIEDTREINLPHSGWKPLHTRYSRSDGANITLFDLVKLSLRERPDFVILGSQGARKSRSSFSRPRQAQGGDVGESLKLERRGAGFGLSGKKISFELERRTAFLESMVGKAVCDYEKLSKELGQVYLSSSLTF